MPRTTVRMLPRSGEEIVDPVRPAAAVVPDLEGSGTRTRDGRTAMYWPNGGEPCGLDQSVRRGCRQEKEILPKRARSGRERARVGSTASHRAISRGASQRVDIGARAARTLSENFGWARRRQVERPALSTRADAERGVAQSRGGSQSSRMPVSTSMTVSARRRASARRPPAAGLDRDVPKSSCREGHGGLRAKS